jgi:hypothetical protein
MVTRDVVEFSSAGIHTTNPSHSGFDSQHRQFFSFVLQSCFFTALSLGLKETRLRGLIRALRQGSQLKGFSKPALRDDEKS